MYVCRYIYIRIYIYMYIHIYIYISRDDINITMTAGSFNRLIKSP